MRPSPEPGRQPCTCGARWLLSQGSLLIWAIRSVEGKASEIKDAKAKYKKKLGTARAQQQQVRSLERERAGAAILQNKLGRDSINTKHSPPYTLYFDQLTNFSMFHCWYLFLRNNVCIILLPTQQQQHYFFYVVVYELGIGINRSNIRRY